MGGVRELLRDARNCINAEEFRQAAALCRQVLQEQPQSYWGLLLLGVSLARLHSFRESEDSYWGAVRVDGENPQAWKGLWELHEQGHARRVGTRGCVAWTLYLIMRSSEGYVCRPRENMLVGGRWLLIVPLLITRPW